MILPAAIAAAIATLASPAWSQAQAVAAPVRHDPATDYHLQAGLLPATLDAIAARSKREIVFDREALSGLVSESVHGHLAPAAAVTQALTNSGYVVEENAAGVLTVRRATTVLVTARRDQAETSFKADRSDTATRSGTSLHVAPGSVTLITSKVLESQQATNLTDALRNVSGMKFDQTPQNTTTFQIRGFQASSDTNGVTDRNATTRGILSVERIEVLKGPQAILSGGDSLGGAVNIVVKKPQAAPIRDVTVQYGTHEEKMIGADLSGMLGSDPRLTFRTVASSDNARGSESGLNGGTNRSFMQALRWKDRSTDLVVSADTTRMHQPLTRYTFARNDGVILPVPDRLLANPADGFDQSVYRFGYQLEQQLADRLVLISRLQVARQSFDLHAPSAAGLSYAKGAAPDSPLPNVTFYGSRTRSNDRTTSGDHYLRYLFPTGEVRHKLSVGYNHTLYSLKQYQTTSDSISVPVFTSTPYDFQDNRDRATQPIAYSETGQRQRGVYAQDLMSYEKWNLVLNARRTQYQTPDNQSTFYLPKGPQTYYYSSTSVLHNTGGAGLVYQLNDHTSLYASYAEGFVPNTLLSCAGGFAPPNETKNREAGAKFDLLDSQFTLTTALFSLQRSNQLVFDRVNNCYNVRDAQRTRGAEVDAQGRLLPGLDAIFNYTYSQVSDVGNSATAFAGIPKHKASVWAVYQFQSAELKGWGVGLGVAGVSASLGTTFGSRFYVPGGSQVDASVFYASGPWNLTLGVKNMFDRLLYSTTVSNSFIPVLPGRTVALTVKRSFK
ncbi:TonB-dependent siderophore receptor [Rugamonas sp. A1-17]|nr:TonB-dependent siderophore receptor [Rugamonas sp. A1-17]